MIEQLGDSVVWFWLVCATLLVTICCAVICHRIALKKEGDLVFWGVLGFLIGPAAIPITWLLAGRDIPKFNTGST